MKRLSSIALSGALLLLQGACAARTKSSMLYAAACASKPLELRLVTRTTFENTYHHHELWLSGKKAATINYETLHSLPYSPDVFGTAAWHYIDTTVRYWQHPAAQKPYPKLQVMLYINTAEWTPAEFEQLYECLKEHGKAMEAVMEKTREFQVYQFGGIVYGDEACFTQRYELRKGDFYEVRPDGHVQHISEGRHFKDISGQGLAMNVEMPGRRILIEDTSKITVEQLSAYRNAVTGHPMSSDYNFYTSLQPKVR